MLTYAEALAALESAERFGISPSLDGILALTEVLGSPQDAFASVQVTGTNGKSSTTRMIAALLEAHGVRTGAYTSPELESMTERIELASIPVSETHFARGIAAACSAQDGAREAGLLAPEAVVTEFELLTAAALWLFRVRHVDIACLEVGMGGRWDATSVVNPAVAVITGVGIDHVDHLGRTRQEIAWDKSHIVKRASTPVFGPGTVGVERVLMRRAEEMRAHPRAVRADGDESPVPEELTVRYELIGRPKRPGGHTRLRVRGVHGDYGEIAMVAPAYQAANAATAIAASEAALGRGLDVDVVARTLAAMRFPGRFEVLCAEPPLVIDGAHNPQAAVMLAEALVDAWPDPHRRPTLLLGILADKDADGIVRVLAPLVSRVAVTQSSSTRALERGALGDVVERATGRKPLVLPDVATALGTLVAAAPHGVLVAGSITTAGEARRWAREHLVHG